MPDTKGDCINRNLGKVGDKQNENSQYHSRGGTERDPRHANRNAAHKRQVDKGSGTDGCQRQ
jgi:FPC/CPF motif-containing protein YcgG